MSPGLSLNPACRTASSPEVFRNAFYVLSGKRMLGQILGAGYSLLYITRPVSPTDPAYPSGSRKYSKTLTG